MLEKHMLESETMEGLSFPKPAFRDLKQHMTIDQCQLSPGQQRYCRISYPEVASSLSSSRVPQGLEEELRPVVSSLSLWKAYLC